MYTTLDLIWEKTNTVACSCVHSIESYSDFTVIDPNWTSIVAHKLVKFGSFDSKQIYTLNALYTREVSI